MIPTRLPADDEHLFDLCAKHFCKTGQLHALYNATDEPVQLFMFGGYD